MIEYPFERNAAVTRQAFDAFQQHFSLVPDYRNRPYGARIFNYSERKVKSLSPEDMIGISPFLFAYGYRSFDAPEELLSPERLIGLMKKKGITKESFLERMAEFEFPEMGEYSCEILALIAGDLKDDSRLETDSIFGMISTYRNRFISSQKKCKIENQGRQSPFSLDRILRIGAEPIAIDYANNGRLYVFDRTGRLQEFTGTIKTDSWQLMDGFSGGYNPFSDIFSPVLPNISVYEDIMFLADKETLQKFNLNSLDDPGSALMLYGKKPARAVLPWEKTWSKTSPRELYHDVCIKEGNIFVSASLETSERYIFQITEKGRNPIFKGAFPRDPTYATNTLQDLTLRLGFFKAGIYFSENNGISLYTPSGPREMIGGYKREQKAFWDIDPITKFAFGKDFMVAAGNAKGFDMPMLQIFSPVYEREDALIALNDIEQPSHFERNYISDIPRFPGKLMSLSAHGGEFAISNPDFDRVFVYKLTSGQ